jgi:ATP-dependent helicase/nuclease subunit A
MNKKLADERARRKIAEELDQTFFVEAGAGSGKTKSLVDRMIALLRAGRCGIGEIAAVTFTRKAAAELRGRFQVELEKAVADGTASPLERERLAAALQSLEQCTIGTIHSFCARLLRERPIESGLDPDFAEMEELENDLFRDDCWSEYLVRARLQETETLRGLAEAGLAPEDLKGAFDSVALYPDVAIVGGCGEPPDYEYLRKTLEDFLRLTRDFLPKQKPEKGYDGLQRLLMRCFVRQRNLGFGDPGLLMETLELLDKDAEIKWNRWPDKEMAQVLKQAHENFRKGVVGPALRAWREYRHEKIVRFLRPAVRFFEERRKEENKLNYEDLLMHAARLLRDNAEVREYFSRRFKRVLVDEFQDTDPIQAEVLMYLKGTDRKEKDWQKLRPEPGSLFLVGDPKQSIYRFRRADIDIYNLFKVIVEEGGGEVLRLTTNFRSLDVLAAWNNPVWSAVLPAEADKYQAAFAPLETVRADVGGCLSGVRKVVALRVARHKGEDIASADAAAIGDWIRWACASRVKLADAAPTESHLARPADFLILTRYKKHMAIYARALEERGIPFEITGSAVFAESEEVGEITNLALALNDPQNPLFTVAVLRGIFFGVSDEQLLEFRREGGRFNLAAPELEVHQSKKLGAVYVSMALARLREWRKWTLELPASAALQRIFEDSGVLSFFASLEMGSSRVGNVLKLLEMVRNEERKGGTSFSRIVRFLEELSEVREIEEMSLTPARENAVRLMNLHKAKGLEAPIVFLANPAGIRDHDVEKHIIRVGTFPTGTLPKGTPSGGRAGSDDSVTGPLAFFVFKEGKDGGKSGPYHRKRLSQPAGWDEAAAEEEKYETAEEVRLQYVAATRARNLLVVSTYAGDMKNKAWKTIDEALEDVPELTISPPSSAGEEKGEGGEVLAVAGREKLVLKKGEVERARQEISESVKSASKPTYAVERVTSLAKEDAELPAGKRDSGLGLRWGRLVHQILEAVGSGRLKISSVRTEAERSRIKSFVENVLAAEEADFSDTERLLAHVESILGSPFWARVIRAEKRYFEIPFSIRTSRNELEGTRGKSGLKSAQAGAGVDPVIVAGTIDLVFREDGKEDGAPKAGWVIADYKTDRIPAGGTGPPSESGLSPEFASLVDYYSPQVRLYARYWQEITGEPVLECGLYFTSINRWVAVPLI